MSKTIGIGITGGIAAYKIADLISRLKEGEFEVIVMMTENAAKFITPLTLKTLSGREVITDLWAGSKEWKVQHIGVAEQLDLLVIAPATANFIAKMAGGIADDFLSTTVAAVTAPVLVVPSMNDNMLRNSIVQRNIKTLVECGYHIMEPETGRLAAGTIGKGRMPEAEDIYLAIDKLLSE